MKNRNLNLHIGAAITIVLMALWISSYIHLPYDPYEMNIINSFAKPSTAHILGTDNFGRDIFSRVLKGSQAVFYVGFISTVTGFVAGSALGAVSGYLGGWADTAITRLTDSMMAFPGIMLALVFVTVFGSGLINISIALGIMGTPRFCRIVRSSCMAAKVKDYIPAARSRGASHFRILFIHIVPNILSPLIATATLAFSGSVLSEAGLSYLGLGIQPPEPSWGKMLYEAQGFMLTQPWYALIPGAMITFMVLGLNLLGEGLRDISDVSM